ncbi:unnamed protein product [Lactuca saligna]|uniref:Uncharacterized protein n=1 Tax=Lactuca saligna TaxID=75948 RepID=A0AA35ZHG6_LACSI|nr:unnamed protein product [Lactuca saligna]
MDVINPILDDVEYVGFIFDDYGTNGKNFVYVDHVGSGIEGWFDDEENPKDEHESCIDGVDNDDLMDVEVEFNKDVVIMNKTYKDTFLSKLCVDVDKEEDNNIVNDDNGREIKPTM